MATAPSPSSPSSPPSPATSTSSSSPSFPVIAPSSTSPTSPATSPSSSSPSLPVIAPSSTSPTSAVRAVIAFHHRHRLSSPSSPSTAPSSSSSSFPVTGPLSSSSPSSSATAPSSSSSSLHVIASSSTSPSSPFTAGTNTTPPPSSSVVPDAVSAVQFLNLCHVLKTRKGTTRWLRSDARNPESIVDHTYGKSLMALIAPDVPGLDRIKCIRMAIIHDTAEVMILDTTGYVDKAIVHQRERTTLYNMCSILGNGEGSRGIEITELWMEYEENSSPEAKFVRDLDKVEMLLQALNCNGDEQGRDLDEFLRSTAGEFQTEIGKAWATEIVSNWEN